MIRFVIIAVAIVAVWLVALQIISAVRKREVDWTGIAFAVGFVLLAFWLRAQFGWS